MAHVPIIQVSRIQEDGDEISNLKKMKPHVPGIVIFADHNRQMPWSVTYHAVVMFADISGFTALCEKYSHMGQSGVDQLTRTLNEYLSALVEGILRSDGDILKFAGDAILAIWRVGRKEELQSEFVKVAKCCLDIQEKCGEWDTDIGVKLTVKIGLAAGEMSVTFLGNKEFRHYVELGPAVTAVNAAEHFCQSGMVVISPDTWEYCEQGLFELEPMEDEKHMRLMSLIPTKRTRSQSLPTTVLVSRRSFERRMSDEKPPEFPAKGSLDLASPSKTKDSDSSDFDKPVSGLKTAVENKFKIGSRFGKLRKIVTAVTEMKLDVALRLYILSPVLKKLDDNQPLEYLSEMRQVSIVFMNLVLSEGIDTASTLQTIFELVYSRTKAMNGSLNKLFLFDKGCTFLLIFGLPGFKSENDCAHALMSSGRMKSQLHKVQGVRNVSIGVTTGTTFCGVVGHPKRHEYSVIGRKVNMAARLMMNYPDKVTCDTDTFQTCRLPASYFVEMATKQLKGLKNVGVIREFAGFSGEQKTVAKQITHSMYPILGRQMEEFMFGDQVAAMRSEAPAHHRHLVFSGPAGIGKTRLLDQILSMSQQAGFRVISCQCDLEDSSYPYFITSHILQSLLRYTGFSEKLSKDAYLTDAVGVNNAQYLFLLNGILDCQLETPDSLIGAKFNEQSKRQQLLRAIAAKCLHSEAIRECVIVIDDAHNVDTSSWQFLCEMVNLSHCLIILSIRPTLLDVPTCRAAKDFMEDPQVKVVDLGSLEPKYMAPLACQMLDVISIPRDLDKLLRERVHGVPLWCMEFLRDLVKNEQLLVVNDDGQSDLVSQSTVAPNQDLIKPLTPARELELPSTQKLLHVAAVKVQPSNYMMDTEKDFLSATGYLYASPSRNENHLTVSDLAQISAGGAMTSMSRPNSSIKPKKLPAVTAKHRLAVFEKDVKPEDIPIPSAMKELVIARIDSMRASEQLLIKCAAVLGQKVRKDILETLMPKAHRSKLSKGIRKLMENGIFECSNAPKHIDRRLSLGERSNVKSKCYCNAEEVAASEPNSVPSCNEPMFTNKLLQETAYEILMESQRIELHTKAATFLELSADVLRQQIPYHILGRPPPREDLENQLKRIDLKMQDLDTMINMRSLRPDNRIADLTFARTAAEMKTKRGRRLAVSVTSENNFPLARKIAEGGTPVEQIGQLIDSLLPVYDSLIYHWKNAKEHTHLVNTMIEAISASVERKKLKKAEELLESAFAALQEASEVPDSNLVTAKLFRMKGK
ncbi:adenylate cyclase type 10-like [Dreissena polymorpha]|uniref:adenylate cyclase type 10-like n=1 Tax=Dreissena polymorpha TaxID=45954 RepID=UPI0022655642|nr:adenylate cyclase type 10-like [Dreissena polymorpha]